MTTELAEARKALRCLYIATEADVARDVGVKVEAAFSSLQPPWQPIDTAPHGVEIVGEDARGVIERTWYFAASQTTRDWLRYSNNQPWHPVRWMPAPPNPRRVDAKQGPATEPTHIGTQET